MFSNKVSCREFTRLSHDTKSIQIDQDLEKLWSTTQGHVFYDSRCNYLSVRSTCEMMPCSQRAFSCWKVNSRSTISSSSSWAVSLTSTTSGTGSGDSSIKLNDRGRRWVTSSWPDGELSPSVRSSEWRKRDNSCYMRIEDDHRLKAHRS